MKKKLHFIALCWSIAFIAPNAGAQKSCGFDDYHQKQLSANPKLAANLEAFEKMWQEKQAIADNTASRVVVVGGDTLYEIPVVFHIIHTGGAVGSNYNPTDAHLQNVIDYLNATYAATWLGYPAAGSGGTNIPIRFVMAKRDPLCAATTGVTRTNAVTALGANGTVYDNFGVARSTGNGITDAQLKGLIQWNPNHYYNIWVVSKIDGWDGLSFGSGVVGYAQFAGGTPASDGTVIMAAFNEPGESTLPHELGHAFNLYHTFQGGCAPAANCSTNGDMICDTDPHTVISNCVGGNNPCTGNPWAPVEQNIMNYTSCPDRFTANQNARAKLALLTQRSSLIQSLGGTVPNGQSTYALPIALSGCAIPGITNAANVLDAGPTNIQVGDLQSYSGGYNTDGNMVYVNRTVPSCLQAAVAPANLLVGQTYPVAVGTGFNPERVRIYIDYNNNGTFDAPGELVFSSDGIVGDQYRTHTGTTSAIPPSAVANVPLRMRVISDFYGNPNPLPCSGNLLYGQTEDFTVIIGATPLPVNVTSITAIANQEEKSISVHWNAATEQNLINYEIERSADGGQSYKTIGSLKAKGSNSAYVFADRSPLLSDWNFYRLKMTDNDLTITYSKIVSAKINEIKSVEFKLYPNPTHGDLDVRFPIAGKYNLRIYNALGQLVKSAEGIEAQVDQPVHLACKELGNGMYHIICTGQRGQTYQTRFTKN